MQKRECKREVEIDAKIIALVNGRFGYPQDLAACHPFFEEEQVEGNEAALNDRYGYGYEKDLSKRFVKEQAEKGNVLAICSRIIGLGDTSKDK